MHRNVPIDFLFFFKRPRAWANLEQFFALIPNLCSDLAGGEVRF
eukprot:SAG31_NODE_7426_length_1691_cov_1.472990_3_plen_43_part_01